MVLSEGSVGGNEVRQTSRRIDVHHFGLQIVGKLRRTRHDFAEQFLHVALERGQFRVALIFQVRLQIPRARLHERLETQDFHHADAVQPFQKRNHVSVGHAHHFVNFGERAHAVQVRAGGRFHTGIQLRHHAQNLLGPFQRVQQSQRTLAAYRQRQHRARKQNRVAHRKNRKFLRYDSSWFGHHLSPWAQRQYEPIRQLIGCLSVRCKKQEKDFHNLSSCSSRQI